MKNYVMTRRIGSTNYRVTVHFNDTGQENMTDKILRMIRNDPETGKWDSTNGETCGMMELPQMSRPA